MLNRKVVIVTGASSGMGKSAAKLFKQQDYEVVAGARRLSEMEDLKTLGITTRYLDVTDEQSNADIVNTALSKFGRIDVLIHSAGYGSFGALEEVSSQEAKNQFNVNVFGLMNLTQLVLPTMRKQHSGKIITISSVGGQIYTPIGGWYYASKHALEALSDSLRLEVKNFGIDVIIIEPGATKTEWLKVTNEKVQESTPSNSPYIKMVDLFSSLEESSFSASEPEDIARLILKAVNAKKPKTRYQPRLQETFMVVASRKLSYKFFDRMMLSQINRIK